MKENIFMAKEKKQGLKLDNKYHREKAEEVLRRLEHPIPVDTLVGDLRVGQQQMIEIARNLVDDDLKVLIIHSQCHITELQPEGMFILY